MKMKNSKIAFALFFCCIITFTGCFPTGKQPVGDYKPTDFSNLPQKIQKQLTENLMVDANIIVPEDTNWHKYQAVYKKLEQRSSCFKSVKKSGNCPKAGF